MEQSLRKLAVRLETSGTAITVSNTKLYKDCYNFVGLQAYVPVTQNRAESTTPLCTVHGIITDTRGERRQLGETYYNMRFVETVKLNGFDYLLFERMMPKDLVSEVGNLDLVFNYSEITAEGKLAARLPTNTFTVYVDEGGAADGDIDVELTAQESAQINQNTVDIEGLTHVFDTLSATGITLPEGSQVEAHVDTRPDGGKNIVISVPQGKQGIQGVQGFQGPKGIGCYYTSQILPQYNTFIPLNTITPSGILIHDFIISSNGNMYQVASAGTSVDLIYKTSIKGEQGTSGQGIPTGGTANQYLAKKSGTDYDTEWRDQEVVDLSAYSTTAQVDVKLSKKADLDDSGKVPASQLPSYVDDVLEYGDMLLFPTPGESGKIYVDRNGNKTYRWSGTQYILISSPLVLGVTSSTACRGDWGKAAYDHSLIIGNPHGMTKADIGLGNVDNTSDVNKPVSAATQTALNGKANAADLTTEATTRALGDTTTLQSANQYTDTQIAAVLGDIESLLGEL